MYGSMLPLLTEFMKPEVIAKMASGAGISDVASAQKTISGAVPAILSGLAGVASKPEGARQLSAAIAGLPFNVLEDLAGMIGGSGQLANIGNGAPPRWTRWPVRSADLAALAKDLLEPCSAWWRR